MYRKIETVRTWLLALLVCFACSCNNDRLETPETDGTTYTYPMRFQGGCATFDGETSTRAPYVWADGDVIYLHFQVGSKQVRGEALYDFDTDLWTVTATEPLASDSEGVCTSVFIHNPSSVSGTKVQLSQQSVVYRDEQSSYLVQDGELTVTGMLLPQTGRIQLRGEANTSFTLSGLSFLTAYDTAGDSFTQAPSKFTATTQADGRTPYYYATFADEAKRELTFTLNSSVALRRTFGTAVLSIGKSGYITIPTMESHEGWEEVKTAETVKTFTVNGVSFNMILVEKGTFMMGATSEQEGAQDDEKPAHSVTLTKDYYIGETEVTQELYQAVMGSNPSSYTGNQRPVECVSWNDCQTFITKLNSLTGLTFRLPTEAEWEFAARGGNKSNGYLYSGSNLIKDVACYIITCNIDDEHCNVKTKIPNELGIYDMSGNVWEFCQDRYDASYYSSSPSINPTGPISGSYCVYRGGCYNDIPASCRVTNREKCPLSQRVDYYGFRLALTDLQEESDVVIPEEEDKVYMDIQLETKDGQVIENGSIVTIKGEMLNMYDVYGQFDSHLYVRNVTDKNQGVYAYVKAIEGDGQICFGGQCVPWFDAGTEVTSGMGIVSAQSATSLLIYCVVFDVDFMSKVVTRTVEITVWTEKKPNEKYSATITYTNDKSLLR